MCVPSGVLQINPSRGSVLQADPSGLGVKCVSALRVRSWGRGGCLVLLEGVSLM